MGGAAGGDFGDAGRRVFFERRESVLVGVVDIDFVKLCAIDIAAEEEIDAYGRDPDERSLVAGGEGFPEELPEMNYAVCRLDRPGGFGR